MYYSETRCDVVVMEVGMGGRFDSTNVIDTPIAAVITTIDYDHMEYLGDTLEKIAYEKAGIIKRGGSVVLSPQIDSVRYVFEGAADSVGACIRHIDASSLIEKGFSLNGQRFDYKGYENLKISLLGDFQRQNAALAVEAVDMLISRNGVFSISERQLRDGLKKATWPGRMELVLRDPAFIVDAAHNSQSVRVLKDSLQKYFPGKKVILVFGVLRDKDIDSMVDIIIPGASAVFTVTPDTPRALSANELAGALKGLCERVYPCDSVEEAVHRSIALAKSKGWEGGEPAALIDGTAHNADSGVIGETRCPVYNSFGGEAVVCAFGSIYFIGHVRDCLALQLT